MGKEIIIFGDNKIEKLHWKLKLHLKFHCYKNPIF